MKSVRNLIIVVIILINSNFVFGCSTEKNSLVYSQAGDVTNNSVVLWGRCNQEKESVLDFKIFTKTQGYEHVQKKTFKVSVDTDYTYSVVFKGLKPSTHYYYQAKCKPLEINNNAKSSDMMSSFKTASDVNHADSVRFVWVADLGGQGWGRNPDLVITHVNGDLIQGGYVVFDTTMSKINPDFALFQGDMIYADIKIPAIKEIPESLGGGTWINEPAKDFFRYLIR